LLHLLNQKIAGMQVKYKLLFSLLLLTDLVSNAQSKPSVLSRPKLVVGIVVDQMRWDYLYRYHDRYQPNGFKRFLNEGFTCENTYINYVPTVTAIGHSTIYTGSVPAIHGIAGNDFIIKGTGKNMYCTDDSTVSTVGGSSTAGKMSPRNLLTSTITDELKLATNFRSKVIGISLKDRGSILPAGHTANAAYWFENATGNWITSTFYMNDLPQWVKKFNEQKLTEKYLKQDWNTLYDIKTYIQSSPDDNPYEGKFSGSPTSTFPVRTSQLFNNKYFDIIKTTPYGNTLTLDMAKAAIDNEQLGKDAVTDFLAVSFSSPDYIGHKFGLNAIETEDTYLRLDRDIANLLSYLDTKVGKGMYTVFLTADHGAAHNPNFLLDNKMPAGYFAASQVQKELNAFLDGRFDAKNIIISFSNSQVHLNNQLIIKNKLNEEAIRKDIIAFLRDQPVITFAVDNDKIGEAGLPEELAGRIKNGYNAKRSGVITYILQPGWYSGLGTVNTGTTHGSLYSYDAHIPLLWMGWGIKHGATNRHTYMTDISPTLAALLRIQEPSGCIGKPIEEVIKR
jgi:predicted AlkP superfamily pyrophosphatase or phosphodiesterase